jgi:UDP-N-acetylglucosamine--N-acetylmuramyl-(pentapeptide) pyrophosphoryl-undecaprenol N-acetylglucosamine transferase
VNDSVTQPTGDASLSDARSAAPALRAHLTRSESETRSAAPALGARLPRSVSVVLAGGGTAGHVEPAMAVADALVALDPQVRITALGTARGLETRLIPERGYPLKLITPVPLPRKPTGDLARLPPRIVRAVRETRAVLDAVDADVVVGFGGYVALPAYLAARGLRRRRRVPVVIHEANASAGLANRVGARTAQRVLSAVADCGLGHTEVVGVPVRAAIAGLDRAALRATARAQFGFAEDTPVLLVFGGSQGAASINRAVAAAAAELAAAGVAVLHAYGAKNTLELPAAGPADPPYVAVPYLDRMDLAYAAADLAICRSGAMTVAEVSAVGLPAVYVPLPIGNGEQRLNALPVVDAGGGMLIADAQLTPDFVAEQVAGLLTDPPRLAAMTNAAARVGHRDAARRVASVALDVARESRRTRAGQPAGQPAGDRP